MKILFLIIVTFSLNQFSYCQDNSPQLRDLFNDGEYFFIREDYTEALYYYVQLLKYEPNNANFNYKAGTCLLNIPGQETKSIPYFQKAIKEIAVNYNRRSINEKGAPLHALYYLGNAYRINNEIEKALDVYNEFISSPEFYGNYNERIVREEIKACERAKIIKDEPIKIKEVNLGEPINTKTADYSAIVSGDDQSIVYVTTLKFYEGLFYSKKQNDIWMDPQNINAQVISDGDMFPTGLSYDGTQLLLVKKSDVNNEIYYSRLVNGLWTKAIPVSDNINSRHNENHASFSKDGNTIYFTSDRRGGNGGFDIYKSEKINGLWQEAENLGEIVNSPFNESAPFLSDDGDKLYFVSDGHFTMGGNDIFYSKKVNGQWKRPVNIGFPINSTSDNNIFVPIKNGKAGYTNMIKDDGIGNSDIYLIEILKGSGDDFSEKDNIDYKNSVMVKLLNSNTNDTTIIWFDKIKNKFFFDVPKGVKVIEYKE